MANRINASPSLQVLQVSPLPRLFQVGPVTQNRKQPMKPHWNLPTIS